MTPVEKPEAAAPKGDAPVGAGDAPEGTDGFGLGHGNGGNGGGGGGGVSGYQAYASALRAKIYEAANRNRRLRDQVVHGRSTSITVNIWMSPDGKVKRAAITNSNTEPEINQMFTDLINALDRIAMEWPADLDSTKPLRLEFGGRNGNKGKVFGG